jgi:lipopolysaccharide transport system ATP-binding protein
VKYIGGIQDTINYYIGEGGSSENQFFDNIETAPGNDDIRIKSFEILPKDVNPFFPNEISIETGIIFRLEFWCLRENAVLDVDMNVKTLDDIHVFGIASPLGRYGEKDSRRGIYTVEFELNPYILNTGTYKAEIFFGENQKYVIFKGFSQTFKVENTLTDQGFSQAASPGFIRPRNECKILFQNM